MKNVYNNNNAIMVLFLVVIITGLLTCTHSNNDQEISMVVDDGSPALHMEELEDHGKLLLRGGMNYGRENCVGIDQPCGPFYHCCGDLHCDGILFGGKCKGPDYCISKGDYCSISQFSFPCCDDGICDGPFFGKCRGKDYCLPYGSQCIGQIYPWPCCGASFCKYDIFGPTYRCL